MGDVMVGNRVVITPLFTEDFGRFYGVEARDEASEALLAKAEQVKFIQESQVTVVEETHYSQSGSIVYIGQLFFSANDEVIKTTKKEGNKQWEIFTSWSFSRNFDPNRPFRRFQALVKSDG